MKSPFLRLAGAGDIDIGAGQMNYVAKASVVSQQCRPGRARTSNKVKGIHRAGARQRPLRKPVVQA
jgi:AsmA protein